MALLTRTNDVTPSLDGKRKTARCLDSDYRAISDQGDRCRFRKSSPFLVRPSPSVILSGSTRGCILVDSSVVLMQFGWMSRHWRAPPQGHCFWKASKSIGSLGSHWQPEWLGAAWDSGPFPSPTRRCFTSPKPNRECPGLTKNF